MIQIEQKPKRVHVGAYVDREQLELLQAIARRDDRSVSAVLRLALAQHLEHKEP